MMEVISCTPWTLNQYSLYRRLSGSQDWSGSFGGKKNLLTLPRIEPQLFGLPNRSLVTTQLKLFFPPYIWLDSSYWMKASSLSRLYDHTQAPRSAGLLWTNDQLDAETFAWLQTLQNTEIHAPRRIRNRNPSKRVAANPALDRAASGISCPIFAP
jgi:hypothetical protein